MNHQSSVGLTVPLFIAVIGGTGGLANAQVTFSDGTFAASNWPVETIGGGSAVSTQVTSGGNPGAFRRVAQTVNAGSTVYIVHRFGNTTTTRYVPATQGAIGSVDFSIDYRIFDGVGQGQAFYLMAKQGNEDFIAGGAVTGLSTAWQSYAINGVLPTDFSCITNPGLSVDFSATGAPIRFGFVTANSSTGAGYSITADYDNFFVRANPVPAPGAALALLGLGTLVTTRRRR